MKKTVKAWALKKGNGPIFGARQGTRSHCLEGVFAHQAAWDYAKKFYGVRLVRVEIRELPKKRRKK